MEIGKAISEYLIDTEIKGYTKKTRDGYRRNLRMFERYCNEIGAGDISDLSMATIKGFSARLLSCRQCAGQGRSAVHRL